MNVNHVYKMVKEYNLHVALKNTKRDWTSTKRSVEFFIAFHCVSTVTEFLEANTKLNC